MKQFMVTCAILPLLLILIMQVSLDQIFNYKLSVVNQAVFNIADRSRILGYYDYDELERVLKNEIGINEEDIEFGNRTTAVARGNLFPYSVTVTIKKPMPSLMVRDKDNRYNYVVEGFAASEKL